MEIIKQSNNLVELEKSIDTYLDVYSQNTKLSYKRDIKDFLDTMKINLFEMKEKDVIQYMNQLSSRNLKNATFNRKMYALQKVSTLFVLNGLMPYNPVKAVREIKKIDKPVERQISLNIDVFDVKRAVERSKKNISLMILFLANTGCRVNEMISIKYSEVKEYNDEYMVILITGKGDKQRSIYLKKTIYSQIQEEYVGESDYLFHSRTGKKLDRSNIYTQIVKAFSKVGKNGVNPHKLRHLFCQYKINTEKQDIKSVSLYVGHSTVNITLDYYCVDRLNPKQTDIL